MNRRRRGARPRARTISTKRITREVLRAGALENPPVDEPRPQTRGDCCADERPCPWVACKHHLYLDVNPETGSIKLNFPDLEPWDLRETCALDVAAHGGATLDEVGQLLNISRERVRQIEVHAAMPLRALYLEHDPTRDEVPMRQRFGANAVLDALEEVGGWATCSDLLERLRLGDERGNRVRVAAIVSDLRRLGRVERERPDGGRLGSPQRYRLVAPPARAVAGELGVEVG